MVQFHEAMKHTNLERFQNLGVQKSDNISLLDLGHCLECAFTPALIDFFYVPNLSGDCIEPIGFEQQQGQKRVSSDCRFPSGCRGPRSCPEINQFHVHILFAIWFRLTVLTVLIGLFTGTRVVTILQSTCLITRNTTIISGRDIHWCPSMFDGASFCNDRDGYPVALHRHVISRFVREKSYAGVKTGGGEIITPAEILLEVFVWEGSRPIMMSILFIIYF